MVLPSAQSLLGDPNDVATCLLPVFAIACVLARTATSLMARIPALAVMALTLAAIVASQSRGGLIRVVRVIGFLGWTWIRSKPGSRPHSPAIFCAGSASKA